jgi:hypothetical protein
MPRHPFITCLFFAFKPLLSRRLGLNQYLQIMSLMIYLNINLLQQFTLFQAQVPLRLPCYDFISIVDHPLIVLIQYFIINITLVIIIDLSTTYRTTNFRDVTGGM